MSVPTFIRHRDRMVQESVFQDLRDTFIACRWMAGTTSRPVRNPALPVGSPREVVTTLDTDVYPLLEGSPLNLIDYFPEAEGTADPATATPLNTFAMDNGSPGDPTWVELGSDMMEQPYVFNFAFYAVSDAVAMSVMNDLRDRYLGRIVDGDGIDLHDYLTDPNMVVTRMDVESFRHSRDVERVAPNEVHLYFAELRLTDFVS